MTIRLMLVDDHKILRDALRAVLEHEADIVLVAETDDPNKVISLAREHQPDIVVMDIGLPQTSGIEVTRHLLQELPTHQGARPFDVFGTPHHS
jgi:DNA-binding NarL/FixJ family response regulator